MAGLLATEDNLLTSGNVQSERTKLWIARRKKLDIAREVKQLRCKGNCVQMREDDEILWRERGREVRTKTEWTRDAADIVRQKQQLEIYKQRKWEEDRFSGWDT